MLPFYAAAELVCVIPNHVCTGAVAICVAINVLYIWCVFPTRAHTPKLIHWCMRSAAPLLMRCATAGSAHFGAVLQSGERSLLCNLSPRVLR